LEFKIALRKIARQLAQKTWYKSFAITIGGGTLQSLHMGDEAMLFCSFAKQIIKNKKGLSDSRQAFFVLTLSETIQNIKIK
jgi:hypothetical protein